MDITILCAVLITGASVLAIPIQMIRHIRTDLEKKLECGEKKFDKIVEQLEKCSDNMTVIHADYAALDAKLGMLINGGKK